WRKACGETCDTQQAHRIFDECIGDVAQYALLNVAGAMERAAQWAVLSLCDRIDRQVATRQVFFERDRRGGMYRETVIAMSGLTFRACQRIFLPGLRVQKYREILAHRFVAEREHLLRPGTDHDMVVIGNRTLQQGVAHGAADKISTHGQECARDVASV